MNLLFLMEAVALFVLESLFVFVTILSQDMTNLLWLTWATYHLYNSFARPFHFYVDVRRSVALHHPSSVAGCTY